MVSKKGSPSELSERDFIQQERGSVLWIFLCIFIVIISLIWIFNVWSGHLLATKRERDPFLQVTNRQFSLFLWQNPDYMLAYRPKRLGYLPDFQSDDDVRVIPQFADDYVQAPEEVLFMYHVWNRLLGLGSLGRGPIPADLFAEFLISCKEWLPRFWAEAPNTYIALVSNLEEVGNTDLSTSGILPGQVKLAYQGWRNYYYDKEKINAMKPTLETMQQFLKEHPLYGRSYWRNILANQNPDYLISILKEKKGVIPNDQLTYFLKAAMFNLLDNHEPILVDRAILPDREVAAKEVSVDPETSLGIFNTEK